MTKHPARTTSEIADFNWRLPEPIEAHQPSEYFGSDPTPDSIIAARVWRPVNPFHQVGRRVEIAKSEFPQRMGLNVGFQRHAAPNLFQTIVKKVIPAAPG